MDSCWEFTEALGLRDQGLGFYWDNGKENGNYYLGFRVNGGVSWMKQLRIKEHEMDIGFTSHTGVTFDYLGLETLSLEGFASWCATFKG